MAKSPSGVRCLALACGISAILAFALPANAQSPSGVWLTKDGQNLENFGVPPDVYIDNTPADHVKGRDAQIEKAVEVLKADLAARVKK